MLGKTGKLFFNENEAARVMGISVDQFRVLLKQHILDRSDDIVHSPQTTYQKSDLVLLDMFARHGLRPAELPDPEPAAPAYQ
jgi:hypothetical protein